ncbi:hypothetical protein EW146_g7666 [Bondarzewia mesenterica]|uniref:Magnesium chelatase n=1 Tax=Bondarzewia mesenterica TaxID=1095465 RepID=A0A4S4LLX5_9AGAM|nr:hypothetical protein EW146_g7666 [Bondarzewia mesenterica]
MDYGAEAPEPAIPGTPQFFPALLEHIRTTAPSLPLDPVILQSLLLCLMSGNRNLILRTRDEDITVVQNLTTLLLTNALSCRTHKHKLRRSLRLSPSSFLTTLFFSQSNSSSSSSTKPSPFRSKSRRSRSYPPPSDLSGSAVVNPEVETLSSRRKSTVVSKKSSLLPGFRSDPVSVPVSTSGVDPSARSHVSADAEIPKAIVVSGLEHISVPCQRSLLHTLLERRVILDDGNAANGSVTSWDLPDDFFIVYVCPWDPRERPNIHKSLLDQFSMSATISLHPNTRHTYASYLASTLSSSIPAINPPPVTPESAPLPLRLLSTLQELSSAGHVYIDASLRLYLADLFNATRHHHELDGTLLGARAMRDAEALVRAHRVLSGGDTGVALIERAAMLDEQAEAQEKVNPLGDSESIIASTRGDRTDEEELAMARAGEEDIDDELHVRLRLHWRDGDGASRSTHPSTSSPSPMSPMQFGRGPQGSSTSLPRSTEWWDTADKDVRWDASEIDVAKVVPRVISHRLRVRDGPEDEILSSAMFLAAVPRLKLDAAEADDKVSKEVWRRRTVKEIIVRLMAEV